MEIFLEGKIEKEKELRKVLKKDINISTLGFVLVLRLFLFCLRAGRTNLITPSKMTLGSKVFPLTIFNSQKDHFSVSEGNFSNLY